MQPERTLRLTATRLRTPPTHRLRRETSQSPRLHLPPPQCFPGAPRRSTGTPHCRNGHAQRTKNGGATLGTRSSKHCALRPSKSYTSTRTRHLNSPAPRAQACSTTCTEPKHARTSLLLYAPALGIADLALVRVEEAGVEAGAELPVRERRSQGRGRRRTACSRRRGRAPSRQ